ncbi:hypothetical protein DACRYDRAFT_24934 [Dacryopinax primogenitus]|uniref:F-box domain-containing protein n=1 Tax=Dacryopinax primogenitus (strain DJM 731) TaxID=1858805 RepID=M5FVY3_DACPD|nr:uncharacterized protein DACRYDRAFT_24934 [Dacryopinax primogenitus]EJT97521.1 hypothetical protein DACRYDRAFT_24934 [Dacryopinax primogenitus]
MYDLTNRAIDSAKRLLQALSRPGAWESITDVAPRSTTLGLFPKLRLLRLQCYSAAHFELGKQVLCDCLISLEVTLEWDMSPEEAEAAMDTIVERCPNLRHLDARLWQLQSVKMLRRLKLWTLAISYPFITEAEIDVLASLKTVRHLSVLAESDDPQITFKTAEHPIASDQNGSLDHLESLIIRTGDSLYLCLIMIRRLQEHKLRNLHIDAECIDDRWVRACVEAIPEHCRRLTSLYLHLRTQNSELKPGEQRNWYTVEPLGRCRDITSFQFTSSSKEDCTAFTWDDADLAAISQAWPRLDKLRLITLLNEYEYDVERYKPRITWRGLATLSKNCPRLKLVQLEFDATESGWPQDEVPVPAEDMEMFCLAWSRVDGSDYEAVARRINYIWPNASVGWGLWYGGQLELPNDHSEDIVNRFPQLEDKSYQEALKVAFAISHYLHYVKQENGPHHPVQLVDCDGSSDNTLQPQAPENIPADTEHIFSLSTTEQNETSTHEDALDGLTPSLRSDEHGFELRRPGDALSKLWSCMALQTAAAMEHFVVQVLRNTRAL